MFDKMSNLGQRTIISLISTIGVWTIIFFSHAIPYLFVAMIAAVIIAALNEFYHIASKKGFHACLPVAFVSAFLYVLAVYVVSQYPHLQGLPLVVLVASLVATTGYCCLLGTNPIANAAVTLFGLLYIAVPLSYLIDVNYLFGPNSGQDGRCWLIYLLTVAKGTDVGGYFIGKKFGRTQIAPVISPKKSVEGAIAGLFAAVAISILFYWLASSMPNFWPMQISFWQSIFIGGTIGILAQFGDLIESAIKRDGDVKDSSTLPGLGGVLDIVDSLIFIPPLVYVVLRVLG
jgi:phosphatidate cytidylyltransferase